MISPPGNSGGTLSTSQTPQPTSTTTNSASAGTSALTLEQLAKKVDHISSYEPALIAVLAVNGAVILLLAGVGIMFLMSRRRSARMPSLRSAPTPVNTVGTGRRPFGRSLRQRGAATTVSTMELTPNEPSSPAGLHGLGRTEYAPVSLQNPEGDLTMYDSPERYRNSDVVSFRTEPFRESAVL